MLPEWRSAYEAFLAAPGAWGWEPIVSWARESPCLPIYVDWTHAFGVTEDGTVIALEVESSGPHKAPDPPNGKLTDVRMLNTALHEGMKRYAWLKDLLPPRPPDAQMCASCNGDGVVGAPEETGDLICYCGGSGWVPADDTWNKRSPR